MGRVTKGSSFLLPASTLLEFEPQQIMDSVIDWFSSFFHSLQHAMDPLINWFVSLISCLATKINPILETFTGHQFNVESNSCDEIAMDGDWLLYVAGAVGVAVAAIVVVWLLWIVIFAVVRLLWNAISAIVLWLCKVVKAIFCCCKRGKTMKAPGRNIRIFRNDFEGNPANYFRKLRIDQRNGCLV